MAGLWYRVGTVSVTNGSKKVTGFGTQFKTGTYKPDKGHTFWGPDGKHYEVDYVESDTVLYLVQAYTGATAAGQSYEIDITRTGTTPALSREVSAMLAYAQGQYDGWQQILTGSGNVTLAAPDGQTISVPALSNMLSKSGNLAGLDAPDTALSNLGMTQVGKAVAKATDAAAGRTALGIVKQTNSADTTVGALLSVGAFGLGSAGLVFMGDLSEDRRYSHFSASTTAATDLPGNNAADWGYSPAINAFRPGGGDGAGQVGQILFGTAGANKGRIGSRAKNNGTWSGWRIFHDDVSMPSEAGSFSPTPRGDTTPGTFTPGSIRGGSYRRIADMCHFKLHVIGTLSGATGYFSIVGLPFVSANDSLLNAVSIYCSSINLSSAALTNPQLVAAVLPNASSIRFYINQIGGTSRVSEAGAIVPTTSFEIIVTGSYKIA